MRQRNWKNETEVANTERQNLPEDIERKKRKRNVVNTPSIFSALAVKGLRTLFIDCDAIER